MDNLVQINVDLHKCEVESISLRVYCGHTDNHPRLSAVWYLCFKESQSLKGLPKISWVTDNLCLEIKARAEMAGCSAALVVAESVEGRM